MEAMKAVVEALGFICSTGFWRMSVLWTVSLIFSYLKLFSQVYKQYSRHCPSNFVLDTAAVQRPVCIITGATSGLGAEAAYALSKEGFCVVLVGRSSKLLLKAISDIKSRNRDACLKAFEVNLSSFKSIFEFKNSFQQWQRDSRMHSSIQLLINNAGILATSSRFTSEGYDKMLATNYIGPFCFTKTLLPLLENSPIPARVVNVTSFTHWSVCCWRADHEAVSGRCFLKSKCYPHAHIYEYSKLCLLLFTYELHKKVGMLEESQHISVVTSVLGYAFDEFLINCAFRLLTLSAADPGLVKTNIMREVPSCVSQMAFMVLKLFGLVQSPEAGVSSVLDAALAPPMASWFLGIELTPLDYVVHLMNGIDAIEAYIELLSTFWKYQECTFLEEMVEV